MFVAIGVLIFVFMCLYISGITWVLVYRTDKYKRLKAEVEKQSKKCELLTFKCSFTELRAALPSAVGLEPNVRLTGIYVNVNCIGLLF